MKRILLISTPLLLFMASCTNLEEPIYSCSPEEHQWVVSHSEIVQSMNWHQWLEIAENNHERGKAIYRAFSPKQKQQFWLDKLSHTMLLDWNDYELKH